MSFWTKFRQLFTAARAPKQDIDINQLQKLLGYKFRNPDLLLLGLTHRSLTRVRAGKYPSNERLEFLGDSVLDLVVAEQLYRDHPELPEGDLTKRKAMLVNETALSRVTLEIGLNEFIQISSEEERNGGRERPSIISDAFEAVIGAIFLDGGLEATRGMIMKCLYSRRHEITNDTAQQNYKGELLELVQGQGGEAPLYEVVSETGPDHNKIFQVAVFVGGHKFGEGSGPSKKDAEQKAACLAMTQLNRESPS